MHVQKETTMTRNVYHLKVQVYYEDTDHSGVVYHPNFLKYFERAREHVIGAGELIKLWKTDGIGFAVYKANLTYSEGVEFGDIIDIRTTYEIDSEYRIIWHHEAWRPNGSKPAVTCELHLVCLDRHKQLRQIPFIDL